MENARPDPYKSPQSAFERRVVLFVLELIFHSAPKELCVDVGDERAGDANFIFCPPRLFPLLRLVISPDQLLGSFYSKGLWYLKKGSLSEFIRYLYTRGLSHRYLRYYNFLSRFRGPLFKISQWFFELQRAPKTAEHYDISPELYELFLDKEMLYTCAFFDDGADTLEEAQQQKLKTIFRRLQLFGEAPNILDIGCGWGSFERFAVRHSSAVNVVGLSIAKQQISWARKKDQQSLSREQQERINYKHESYLDHSPYEGGYDAVVVVGMIEHVGKDNYLKFLNAVYGLCRPGARVLIHTIICPTSDYPANKWIASHIFPGGYIPSVSELVGAAEESPFLLDGIFIHAGENYLRTLKCWLKNFLCSWAKEPAEILEKFPDRRDRDMFFRTWYFYLSSTQNMFHEDVWKYQVAHIVLRK